MERALKNKPKPYHCRCSGIFAKQNAAFVIDITLEDLLVLYISPIMPDTDDAWAYFLP